MNQVQSRPKRSSRIFPNGLFSSFGSTSVRNPKNRTHKSRNRKDRRSRSSSRNPNGNTSDHSSTIEAIDHNHNKNPAPAENDTTSRSKEGMKPSKRSIPIKILFDSMDVTDSNHHQPCHGNESDRDMDSSDSDYEWIHSMEEMEKDETKQLQILEQKMNLHIQSLMMSSLPKESDKNTLGPWKPATPLRIVTPSGVMAFDGIPSSKRLLKVEDTAIEEEEMDKEWYRKDDKDPRRTFPNSNLSTTIMTTTPTMTPVDTSRMITPTSFPLIHPQVSFVHSLKDFDPIKSGFVTPTYGNQKRYYDQFSDEEEEEDR